LDSGLVVLIEYDEAGWLFQQFAASLLVPEQNSLGIVGVSAVSIGSPNTAAAAARWEPILGARSHEEGLVWRRDDSPSVRLVDHFVEETVAIEMAVRSPVVAAKALASAGLSYREERDSVLVDPDELQGLEVKLVALG
jgi:hypothetical protein